jgi:transcriptional regulator with XRE-family HTH domain
MLAYSIERYYNDNRREELHILYNNIRILRKSAGYTLKELSNMSSISIAELSQVERGNKKARTDLICRVAKALNVTPNEILNFE